MTSARPRQRRRGTAEATSPTQSTQLRRYIGRRLQALREENDLTQQQAADLIDHSRHWISLAEAGAETVRFRPLIMRALLAQLGADAETQALLLSLAAEAQQAGTSANWWHDYHELPSSFALYVELEHSAAVIRQYATGIVPGLLQTRAYAEQILSVPAGFTSDEERARQVRARVSRQRQLLLRDPAPRLEVILDETVLRRAAGDGPVMAEQLSHLLQASQRDNVTVRVIPFDAGIHGAAGIGQFTILDFPVDPRAGEPLESPLVCVDTPAGAALLQKTDALARYELIWADLQTRALTEGASRESISTARESYHGQMV